MGGSGFGRLAMALGLVGCAAERPPVRVSGAGPAAGEPPGETWDGGAPRGLAGPVGAQLVAELWPADLGDDACLGAPPLRAPCAPHRVYAPTAREPAGLLVFLPGSGMEPDKHDLLLELAAEAGFLALGLSYDSRESVWSHCDGTPPEDRCHERERLETLTGIDLSVEREVRASQAIVPRLVQALEAVHDARPSEGWDDLIRGASGPVPSLDDVEWSRITLAGFSEGAGNASLLAQLVPARGVWMIEQGVDVFTFEGELHVASWVGSDGATDPGRRFLAVHRDSRPACPPPEFGLLGMDASPGRCLDADARTASEARGPGDRGGWTAPPLPFLATDQDPVDGHSAHASMARDGAMPAGRDGRLPAEVDGSPAHLAAAYRGVLLQLAALPFPDAS